MCNSSLFLQETSGDNGVTLMCDVGEDAHKEHFDDFYGIFWRLPPHAMVTAGIPVTPGHLHAAEAL